MNATVEKLSGNKVKLYFDVTPEEFEAGMAKAYNKVKGRVAIPGFRKGRAPRKVIEMHYGESIFYDDAFDALFPDLYEKAVKDNSLEPVDRPSVDLQEIGGGKGMKFTAEVFVSPEVELGEYKGIKASKQLVDVTEDDVNAELERARDRVARYVDVTDRPVKLDDQVDIDYSGFCEGEQFEGGTAEGHKLVVGSGSFIPGFEDQLIGATVGQELDVNVTFPEEYHAENLAGKPAVFKVKVNAIQEKEVPALDDEFAKDVSECDTLAAYKDQIRENLTKKAEEKADAEFEKEVVEEAVENAKVDIPDPMIESQTDSMLRDMEMRMAYQGIKLDDYLKYTGMTREQLRDNMKEEAENRVRTQLVLEAIRKAEGIEATDEETDAEIAKYADAQKGNVEDFKKNLRDEDKRYFADIVATTKTIDMLKSEASPE